MTAIANRAALHIFQEALIVFANWAGTTVQYQPVAIEQKGMNAIAQAKTLVNWSQNGAIGTLRLVFDAIKLDKGQKNQYYYPAWAIENTKNDLDAQKSYPPIPYPLTEPPADQHIQALKNKVKEAIEKLTDNNWQQFSLLMLIIEKFGSYLSFGAADIAFFDQVKATAAVAAALVSNPDTPHLALIAGDLSGIQDFIYTISSDGALKSLRARSFTLELVTEEIVQQLLCCLGLPRSNVIYAGGGNLYLLAPVEGTQEKVGKVRDDFNHWLLDEYQGKVFLALDSLPFEKQDVGTPKFAEHWEKGIQELARQKSRKFENQLDQLLAIKPAHEPCKVCHRDDTEDLKPLDGDDGVDACPTCRHMFKLGQKLFGVGALVRSPVEHISGTLEKIKITVGDKTTYYHLFEGARAISKEPQAVYLINNWDIELYKFSHFENPTPLLLGNYAQKSEKESGFLTAQEMAEDKATGVKRVGHLRMDVDKLGQIFARGLKEQYTLTRLSGLSRQMSYFFKVYLNSLAEFRERDFLDHQKHQNFQSLTPNLRQDILFIYAGGDDLFVSGAWDQVVEFAFDVYQSFRAFTGWHPDITLSAGVSLSGSKYPLYQSADDSGKAEDAAKGNGRGSLSLFDQVFKWQEWLGTANTDILEQEVQNYLEKEIRPEWFGIFPFVNYLQELLGTQYSRSFVRNLLSTAQLQEQWIKKLKKDKEKAEEMQRSNGYFPDEKDLRYFLHLPRVAYTLARFPVAVKNSEGFDVVRKSLKSPYNAPYFRAIATWLDLLNR